MRALALALRGASATAVASRRESPAVRRLRGARRYRLTGTGAFQTVFAIGARRDGDFVQLIAAPARAAPGRVGFVIPRKVVLHAVDRNRLRRVLRAAVAAARPGIERFDLIVRVKRASSRDDARAVAADARALLAALRGR